MLKLIFCIIVFTTAFSFIHIAYLQSPQYEYIACDGGQWANKERTMCQMKLPNIIVKWYVRFSEH